MEGIEFSRKNDPKPEKDSEDCEKLHIQDGNEIARPGQYNFE